MSDFHALIIGGGQSGLAGAQALRARGLRPVVLEAGPEAVGSWPSYYDSLTLFTPARFSSLPGLPCGGDPDRYPTRDEHIAYLRRYSRLLDVDIRTGNRVIEVSTTPEGFAAHLADGQVVHAPSVVAATGYFGRPHHPELPGLDSFPGTVLHSADYRRPDDWAGRRVIVVGAGNSAVQIAVELADHAVVTLATRGNIRWAPQRVLGRDVHFWIRALGVDRIPASRGVRERAQPPTLDLAGFRKAVAAGRPDHRRIFDRVEGEEVIWPNGARERVDMILLATGYRPDFGYLRGLGALDSRGAPRITSGWSATHRRLAYLGVGNQRTLGSDSIVGVGADARAMARRMSTSLGLRRPTLLGR
ncbi:flavin-containing monooxygenase [Actinoalloteichus spitiensis]|uniref:flavin-containing monooxygenase n=1 Tax=Actinoalloteichus spitiensis TaxID=252394 RepID=UPI00035F34B5|nr:NAD(P)/FAD-dependent oxidoreductase [Actinoalloteichus spitiensis]